MFNKKLKQFQEHWSQRLYDLRKEAEGLLEWFQVLENHNPTQLNSGEFQDRHNSILAVYNTLELQQSFLPDQPAATELLADVKGVLEMINEALVGERPFDKQFKSTSAALAAPVSIDDIVKRNVMTIHDVKAVLGLPYSSFIQQVTGQPVEAKRYAYMAVLREFLNEIRKQRIYNFNYLSEVSDDLHNIPEFIAVGFDSFDDDYFWSSIFNKQNEAAHYIVRTYLSGLAGYYSWRKRS